MVSQLKLETSPFAAADWSMKEAAPQRNWEAEAESRIGRSDVVVVFVGPNTHKVPGTQRGGNNEAVKKTAIVVPNL